MAKENNNNDQFEELCSGYVLQALDSDEREHFEQLLEDATEEQQELYRALRSAANQLAFSVNQSAPSEAVKEQLMAKVRADSDASADSVEKEKEEESQTENNEEENGFNWSVLSVAASFALLIVSLSLLFYSFNLSSRSEEHTSELQSRFDIV